MTAKTIDNNFRIFSILQSIIILYGFISSTLINYRLGWNWFFFFFSFTILLFLINSFYLFRFHKKSVIFAFIFLFLQLVNFESQLFSFTLSFGFALNFILRIGSIKIIFNLFALPLFIWITYLFINKKMPDPQPIEHTNVIESNEPFEVDRS